MKVFHIEQFKCSLCSNWFCPPYNLPYLLKCTHSICTNCLQKSASSNCKQIICPEDLQKNKISQININQSTKKALQRLMKQHKNFNDTNYLQCIKTLSLNFDQILDSKQVELKNFSELIDQIFQDQIKRLKGLYQKIKLEIHRPFRIVNDWKDIVKGYLTKVKKLGNSNSNSKAYMTQLSHYIQQGRKIKMDLNEYIKYNFKQYTDLLIQKPEICFNHNFSVFDSIKNSKKVSSLKDNNLKDNNLKEKQVNNLPKNILESQFFQKNVKDQRQLSLFQKITNKTPRQQLKQQILKQNRLGKLIFSESISEGDQKLSKNNPHISSKFVHQSRSPFSLTEQKWINSKFQSPQRQFKGQDYDKLQQKLQKLKRHEKRQPLRDIILNENKLHNKQNLKQSLQYSPQAVYQNYTFQDSNSKIKIESSPNKYRSHLRRYDNNDYDQILLEDDNKQIMMKNNCEWHLENYNFLKEWQMVPQKKEPIELQIKQKVGGYNCQKQKQKYTKKIQLQRAKQAYDQTMQKGNIVELINCQLDVVDLNAYLSNFNWTQIQILKLVRTSLKDSQVNQLLNYLAYSNVHTLVLSSNNLTEMCIDALLYFVQVNKILKNVYLSKNNINTLKGNTRAKIQILKQNGINLYV